MISAICTSLPTTKRYAAIDGMLLDFLPAYYQACKNATPTRSGVEIFGLAIPIGPVLLMTGASIAITKTYRVQLWLAWCLTVISMGVMSTLRADSSLAHAVGYPIFLGIGSGIWYAATYFPVLAPLPVSENAHALAFFSFCRSFASVGLLSHTPCQSAANPETGVGRDHRHGGVPDAATEETSPRIPRSAPKWR